MNVNPNQSTVLASHAAQMLVSNPGTTTSTNGVSTNGTLPPVVSAPPIHNNNVVLGNDGSSAVFEPTLQTAPPNLLANAITSPGPDAFVKHAATGLPTANEEPTGEALTLAGLMEAWGTSDTDYDLTKDGMVDVSDLLAFVAKEQSEPEGLSQEGFAKAWGTDDPTYDLTKDGTVDVRDLLAFLEGLDPQARVALDPTLAAAAGLDDGDADSGITIAGLMEAWGRTESRFDVTQDGRVDVSDLLSVLGSSAERDSGPAVMAGTEPAAAAETSQRVAQVMPELVPATPTRSLNGNTPVVDQGDPTDIDGVRKAWGTGDARFDHDDSGVVDVEDLLAAIAARVDRDDPSDPPTTHAAPANDRPTVSVAQSIVNRLVQAGFVQQPPVNLHELLNEAGINGNDRDDVLQGVAQRYPNGLGLNVRV